MLIDTYDRVHDYLRISLTDKCNFRCSYCTPYDLPKGFYADSVRMTADEIEEIASVFVQLGIKKIRITGGEPLVRKDAKRIIQRLSKFSVELCITTNGVFVDEYIALFKEAGIKTVNVSLDSLESEKFFNITKRDEFEKVLSNIHLLLLNDFKVKVNVVAMKGVNEFEIVDFVEWTKEFPLHIRFIEFMPFLGNNWEWEKVFTYKQILELIEARYDFIKLRDETNDTAKKFKIPGYKGAFAIISTMTEQFCGDCNRLRLTADGKMKNCLFSNDEMDLLTPLRNGTDIRPLIYSCVINKQKERGGQVFDEKYFEEKIKNRSMVAIGG